MAMRFSCHLKSANFVFVVVRGHVTLKEAKEGFEKSHILADFSSGATVMLKRCMACRKRPLELLGLQNIVLKLGFKGRQSGHVDLR